MQVATFFQIIQTYSDDIAKIVTNAVELAKLNGKSSERNLESFIDLVWIFDLLDEAIKKNKKLVKLNEELRVISQKEIDKHRMLIADKGMLIHIKEGLRAEIADLNKENEYYKGKLI